MDNYSPCKSCGNKNKDKDKCCTNCDRLVEFQNNFRCCEEELDEAFSDIRYEEEIEEINSLEILFEKTLGYR